MRTIHVSFIIFILLLNIIKSEVSFSARNAGSARNRISHSSTGSSKDRRPHERRPSAELSEVKIPVDQEVCFSPIEPCDLKLIQFVNSAKASIDVAVFDVTLDQFVHHLLNKARQMPVRIIVDRRQAKGPHSLVPLLIKAGVNVRIGHQRGVMHNKFTIVDGQSIETGSFNYTNHATQANNENQIYLSNPQIVSRYKERFEQIWREAVPVRVEKLLTQN